MLSCLLTRDDELSFDIIFSYVKLSQNFPPVIFWKVDDSSCPCIYTDTPARTVGWRDPGYLHTSFLKELWPNKEYDIMSYLLV